MISIVPSHTDLNEREKPMTKLSRSSIYALRAALLLGQSQPGVPVPCRQLAREGKMPERFLLQVLRRLVKHKLLESTCGVAGGYYLARSPQLISLRDILDASDSATLSRRQVFDFASRDVSQRVAETVLNAENAARLEFQKLTLANLIGDGPAISN
jgi:Rrf2 family protein